MAPERRQPRPGQQPCDQRACQERLVHVGGDRKSADDGRVFADGIVLGHLESGNAASPGAAAKSRPDRGLRAEPERSRQRRRRWAISLQPLELQSARGRSRSVAPAILTARAIAIRTAVRADVRRRPQLRQPARPRSAARHAASGQRDDCGCAPSSVIAPRIVRFGVKFDW